MHSIRPYLSRTQQGCAFRQTLKSSRVFVGKAINTVAMSSNSGDVAGAMPVHERAHAVLSYWFGEAYAQMGDFGTPSQETMKLWYSGGPNVDQFIRDTFMEDFQKADNGEYDEWKKSPFNCMAGIVLFDQFSRNMFRKDPRMFATDDKGLEWTMHLLDSRSHMALPAGVRYSLCLPFMHSEKMEMQNRGLEFLTKEIERHNAAAAAATAGSGPDPKAVGDLLTNGHKYAKLHADIIAKWGRFPHRNAVLKREDTPEEKAGLADKSIASF